jgi:hypothetical protein
MTQCDVCGSTQLFYGPPAYDGDTMTEDIRCEDCEAAYQQTWKLHNRELVRPGS